MRVLLLLGLSILLFGTGYGCADQQMDREIRDAVSAIDVQAREDEWWPPDWKRFRQVCERYSYYHDKVATLLLDLYGSAPGPHQKAQALSAMEVFVRQYPFSVAVQQLKEVGTEALFDEDVAVSVSGLRLLKAIEPPDLRDLVRRQLASTKEVDLAEHALLTLDPDEAWEYLRSILSNSDLRGESFSDWQARSRLILRACNRGACWTRPPAALAPVIVEAVVNDATLAKEAARVLVNCRRDASAPSGSEALSRISHPAARLRMEAAFIALSEDPLKVAEHTLDRLHDAAVRYRGEDECWSELVVRTRCLAFAACASLNLDLLRAIWSACSPLKTRDRGELLEVIAHEFWSSFTEGVTFPAAATSVPPLSPSELFPVFLAGLPTDELKAMAGMCYPDLGREVSRLLALKGAATGPDSKDRDQIEEVATRLQTLFGAEQDR